jgi:hypothetical protein
MARSVTKYTIFLSSPSDLVEERTALEEVVKELNLTYGNANNCVIELLKWETHSAPGISRSQTQDIINNDIGDDYDIFLGLLWKRFGTPTQNADSGTEEEFNRALSRFQEGNLQPQILFYFKNSVPNSLSDIDPEQFLKVNQFKKSIPKDKMLSWEFDTVENLQNFVRLHIPKRIESISNVNTKVTLKEKDEIMDLEEFGLFDYSDQFESLLADSSNSLVKISESTEWIGKEITNKAEELTQLSKNPNPNKYVVTSILKRTAKLMNDYSGRLEVETPIFYLSFEEGIKAGINLINLVEDFTNDDTIQELEESKKAIIILRKAIPKALEGLKSFRESISELPRIQKDINLAKRKLLSQLDELIEKLNQSLELAKEFSDEIGSKIDKMKLI